MGGVGGGGVPGGREVPGSPPPPWQARENARERQGALASTGERQGTPRNFATSTRERQEVMMNTLGSTRERRGTRGTIARTHSIGGF